MLSLFIVHCFVTLACLFAGFLTYSVFFKQEQGYKPIIVYLVTGLISITMVGQLMVLFFPMNNYCRIVILGVVLTGMIIVRSKIPAFLRHLRSQWKDCPPIILTTIIVCWGMILLINAGPIILDDTESYHIQTVKWIQEYGTVPGLANLHGRFGFNSSWFTGISIFTLPGQPHNYYGALNGVVSLWFAAYLLSLSQNKGTVQKLGKNTSYPLLFLVPLFFSLLAWPLIRGNASNCNYDFISTIVIFIIFSETLLSNSGTWKKELTLEWILWPSYLFTVRILNFPYLLLSAYGFFLLFTQKRITSLVSCLLIGLLLVFPFLARNLILSGYPFYPSLNFDWFSFDWKADREKTMRLLRYIKYFNRVNAGYQSIDTTATLGFPQWIFAWYQHLFSYDKLLLFPGMAGIVFSPLLIRQFLAKIPFLCKLFIIAFYIHILSWFFIAPDPRFIYNVLLSGILLLFIPMVQLVHRQLVEKAHHFLLISLIIALPVFSFLKIIRNPAYRNWLAPLTIPQPPVRNLSVGTIQVHLPEKILGNWNSRCYATELPCLYEIDSGLTARGNSLAAGFKIKK